MFRVHTRISMRQRVQRIAPQIYESNSMDSIKRSRLYDIRRKQMDVTRRLHTSLCGHWSSRRRHWPSPHHGLTDRPLSCHAVSTDCTSCIDYQPQIAPQNAKLFPPIDDGAIWSPEAGRKTRKERSAGGRIGARPSITPANVTAFQIRTLVSACSLHCQCHTLHTTTLF